MMDIYLRVFLFESLMALLLFVSAGRWDLPWFWAVIGVHTTILILGFSSIDRELQHERMKPGPGGKDRLLRVFMMPFFMAHLVVAGLDVGRFHWSGPLPIGLQAAGLAVYVAAISLSVWAMLVNRFFSPVVRIQGERGHHLITGGPYGFVRHPGYLGVILASLSSGVALGSWWSLVPLLGALGLVFRRTILEDRMLRAELPGYADYAKHVCYRLLPGVW
jgi:protein-S-isoprenylcysteine O-methyltransferase Ste14